MREIDYIVIHCTDTPNDREVHIPEIREWHKQRGFDDVGYHWLICRDGSLEQGRLENVVGAHCQGHNNNSIGIALAGRDKFDYLQWVVLTGMIQMYKVKHPKAQIVGHRDFNPNKTCPNFNVATRTWNLEHL